MDNTKPVTAADIAKMKKNGKTMLAISGAVLALVIILTVAAQGAPTWMIIITGMTLALGAMELWKAKKAEEKMKSGSAMTPPSEPTM